MIKVYVSAAHLLHVPASSNHQQRLYFVNSPYIWYIYKAVSLIFKTPAEITSFIVL